MTIDHVSDIDMIYPRSWNQFASYGGAAVALITTLAVARIGEAVAKRFVDWDASRVVQAVVVGSACVIGLTTGHIVTAHCIGLIAKSALAKFTISIMFNAFGTLAGIAVYYQTRDWI